jgi:hypothetical protein
VLGQDAIIEPFEPTPGEMPTPEPFGGPNTVVALPPTGTTPAQAQAPAAPPVQAQAPAPAAKPGWMVKIGGKAISGWTLVLSSAIVMGGIALVVYTKEDIDMLYAKKGKKK